MKKEGLSNLSNKVENKFQNRMVPVIVTLLSVALIALSRRLYEMEDLSTTLLTVAIVALVAAVAKLLAPSKKLVYTPTGEVIRRKTFNHPQENLDSLAEALTRGDMAAVEALSTKGSAPLMSVTYSTPSGSFVAGQIFAYIAFEYTPQTEATIVQIK